LLILTLIVLAQSPTPMHCGTSVFEALKRSTPVAMPQSRKNPEPMALGESRLMWLQNMSVMPPQQYQAQMTCRALGEHVYVMVDDSSWDAGLVDSADVWRIAERFDRSSPRDSTRGVWQHNTSVLGQPPDAIDNDSLIYLLYYNVGEFHGYLFDGFWQYFDEYYDTTAMRVWGYHSNEVECVYLDLAPNNPSQDYRVAIAAHEFSHMIHWNYDRSESLWVNEGCAELAMWLFGSPDPISQFNSNPDNDLTSWGGEWADYIKTYLFFLYLYEQHGGRVGTELIHNIVASPFVSIEGIDSAFAVTGLTPRFEDLLDDWVLANIINDTSYLDGRYGYFGERVPRFAAAYHGTYPVSRTASLNRWAGEYLLFQRGRGLELTFDGNDAGDFRLYIVGKDSLHHRLLFDSVPLDPQQSGAVSVPNSDTGYQSVWLAPVSHYPYGSMGYSYGATASGIEERPWTTTDRRRDATHVRAGAVLSVAGGCRVFDSEGRLVATGTGQLATAGLSTGAYWLEGPAGAAQPQHLIIVR